VRLDATRSRRRLATGLAIAALAAVLPLCSAYAQVQPDWKPERLVTLVVPYGAGGGTDAIARALAKRLGVQWDRSVVVENVPGANGLIGSQRVMEAKPDGYTLLVQVPGIVLTKYTPGLKGIDPVAKLQPISVVMDAPNVLVSSARITARTLPEFLTVCRSKPSCSLATVDSTGRVLGLQLAAEAPVENLIIAPYRGAGGAMVTDLIANNVDFAISGLTAVLAHQKAGTVRVLATMGTKRSAALPEVPTSAEAGLPRLISVSWVGLFAPQKTPSHVVEAIAAGIREAVTDKDVSLAIQATGGQAVGSSTADFAARLRVEDERLAKLVGRYGLE
jgi:tripartite-type tricarboxylate transporter receptor subunit TctC